MTTMNISLPDSLKFLNDEQVATRGFGTSSEYMRELIRKEVALEFIDRLDAGELIAPSVKTGDKTLLPLLLLPSECPSCGITL